MKIEQIEGRLLLKKPKIIDPLYETETIKDVMLVDGKIEEIGIIEAENGTGSEFATLAAANVNVNILVLRMTFIINI